MRCLIRLADHVTFQEFQTKATGNSEIRVEIAPADFVLADSSAKSLNIRRDKLDQLFFRQFPMEGFRCKGYVNIWNVIRRLGYGYETIIFGIFDMITVIGGFSARIKYMRP
jgi:hypothetical protein